MNVSAAIKMSDLNFSYDGFPVLENVNLAIDRNDFSCIIGPNGGGKTTLLKLVLGILRPTSGEMTVLGMSPVRAIKKIGYVSQNFLYDPSFPIEAFHLVLMGRIGKTRNYGPYSRLDKKSAEETLKEMNLFELRHRHF